MRALLFTILILVVILGGIVGWLILSTPSTSAGLRYPLPANQRALLGLVPASADSFALIPTAAALESKVRANPITREASSQWMAKQNLPNPWIIGSADLVAWRHDKTTSYALALDPLRAKLVKLYLMFGATMDVRWSGTTLLINAPVEPPIAGDEMARLLAATDKLPPGDALIVQRELSRGAFPPIARPAVTSAQITSDAIVLTSRAPLTEQTTSSALDAKFPKAALLTATFGTPPKSLDDLGRLLGGARISTLLGAGGTVALYDVDAHKLLPRPRGVIVLPADDQRRATFNDLAKTLIPGGLNVETHRRSGTVDVTTREGLGYTVESADTGSELLLAFDRSSIDLYIKDAFEAGRWPGGRWAMRMDAPRLVPILEDLGHNPGFRIAAPHLFRSAKDVSGWIHYLEDAKTIEAADSADGSDEQLQVRVTSK